MENSYKIALKKRKDNIYYKKSIGRKGRSIIDLKFPERSDTAKEKYINHLYKNAIAEEKRYAEFLRASDDDPLFDNVMQNFRNSREAQRLKNRIWVPPAANPEDDRHYRCHALIQVQDTNIPIYPCLINIVMSYLSNRK